MMHANFDPCREDVDTFRFVRGASQTHRLLCGSPDFRLGRQCHRAERHPHLYRKRRHIRKIQSPARSRTDLFHISVVILQRTNPRRVASRMHCHGLAAPQLPTNQCARHHRTDATQRECAIDMQSRFVDVTLGFNEANSCASCLRNSAKPRDFGAAVSMIAASAKGVSRVACEFLLCRFDVFRQVAFVSATTIFGTPR